MMKIEKILFGLILISTSFVNSSNQCRPGGICIIDDLAQKQEIIDLLCGNLDLIVSDCDIILKNLT